MNFKNPYLGAFAFTALLVFCLGVVEGTEPTPSISGDLQQQNKNLLIAAQGNSTEGVRYALKHGADVNHTMLYGAEKEPTPAIVWGIYYSNLAMVTLLLDWGADINFINSVDTTLLMYASFGSSIHVVSALLHKNALIDAVDNEGNTALMYAVVARRADVVELLLKKGANKNIVNNADLIALQVALQMGDSEITNLLAPKDELESMHDTQ